MNGHRQESFGRSYEIEIPHLTQQSCTHTLDELPHLSGRTSWRSISTKLFRFQ